ncbi:MAG: ribonucleoside-diphosphate reductase, adenosylcobalamin-dependent, partial [Muribaculaceae bacterium]|nr:ribonucleoside-diphosphate reductase, adenosylcobalamin-dependent [Muribaculaceae bacterium]
MDRPVYNYDEAFNASLKYFDGDELAARVWVSKYALKDSANNLYELTPDDMHRRLAGEIARIEDRYPNAMSAEEIFSYLKDFRYIVPQGSPMTGIGNDLQVGSLSNCFVIGLDGQPDSYGGIILIDQEQVQLMKRRGGVGHDLSHLRPKGSPVKNSALTSTGLVPFMERYSNSGLLYTW